MANNRALSAEKAAGDDAALVARIVGGDLAAFEQLMRHHNTALFRAARAIVRDDADAEDVVQEAIRPRTGTSRNSAPTRACRPGSRASSSE